MKIESSKIPLKFKELPDLIDLIDRFGKEALLEIVERVSLLPGKPSNSNATFIQIAAELSNFANETVFFKFYCSKNPVAGHNVISHANKKNVINYNTRFHSVESFMLLNWFKNFFHELTHLADQRSHFSFNHKNQRDELAAPMIVAEIAGEVLSENVERWL